jgi:hypothetical protein
MTSEQAFFIFATAVDFVTAFWIIGALFTDKLQRLPRWHLMGLSVGALGLLFQGMRNIQFLTTGVSPSDADLPVWFLKDMGYALIAFHSIWLILQGRLHLNKQPEQPPVPASEPVAAPAQAKPKPKPRAAVKRVSK